MRNICNWIEELQGEFSPNFLRILHEYLLGLEASIAVCHPEIPGSNLPLNPPKNELKNCPLNLIILYILYMYISLMMI